MQRDEDLLIQHLKVRAEDPVKRTWMAEHFKKTTHRFPPIKGRDVDHAERILGFEIPPFLARVYREVGNGGWGPGYGLLRLLGPQAHRRHDYASNTSSVRETLYSLERTNDTNAESYQYREKYLTFCFFGCTYYSVVDCTTSDGKVWGWDMGEDFHETLQAHSVFEWLEIWVEGKMDGFGWALPSDSEG